MLHRKEMTKHLRILSAEANMSLRCSEVVCLSVWVPAGRRKKQVTVGVDISPDLRVKWRITPPNNPDPYP